uniref:phenylalanyl-tRNA synthetase beta subunit n=1 Tax=Sahlingia subintegra TaxID=468936 RepID=UPI001FCD9254|nr:phenylalanyl-tRNA synthetase beta subunit [Sahlingia subintegra]UNJ17283.1 phenylalanyl-tRNA synthetase beta subunit [Sahlingia subintegra]
MKISWEWLNQFVDLKEKNIDPEQLSDKLTLAGCEIEEINHTNICGKEDYILDITSTPNRSDLLGMIGIAKEISTIMKLDQCLISDIENNLILSEKNIEAINYKNHSDTISISNSSCFINNLSPKPTPQWIKSALYASGIDIHDDIKDIMNYVMVKWGHPIEIVDTSKFTPIHIKDIQFKYHNPINDTHKTVVTKYKNQTVSLTGVKIENDYKVTNKTTCICLQSLVIPRKIIRINSKYSNLRTESSIRHERGLNEENMKFAILEAILLIKKIYPEALVGKIYNNIIKKQDLSDSYIKLDLKKTKKTLGKIEANGHLKDIGIDDVKNILLSLGCSVIDCNTFFKVAVPFNRKNDLYRDIDLIEEIARIQGFNSFKAKLPEFKSLQTISKRDIIIKEISKKLRSLGFTEVIHYSLAPQKVNERIKLENPLMNEYSCLRSNLILNLIESFNNNIKKGASNFDTFEIGRIFFKDNNLQYSIEKEILGGIFGGRLIRNSWQSPLKNMDWFKAKGILELLLNNISTDIEWKNYIDPQYNGLLHPGRSASIHICTKKMGTFGQIHPRIINEYNLPNYIYCFEIDLELILKYILKEKNYSKEFTSYSLFPSITRDIAIITPITITVDSVIKIIKNDNSSVLKHVTLFDEYKGGNIAEGYRSIAFRLTYQSKSKTLTNEEVDKIHTNIKQDLKEKLNAEFR